MDDFFGGGGGMINEELKKYAHDIFTLLQISSSILDNY